MTKRLNQILATEKSLKGRVETVVSQLSAAVQKQELMDGFSKVFTPIKEDFVAPPKQDKKVQYTSKEVFQSITKMLGELFTTTAMKDVANCTARADVVVGGEVILKAVPATNLLFLDKQLTQLHTLVSKFAELSADVNWTYDPNTGYYRSEDIKTQATQKHEQPLVMAPATDKHPAQVQMVSKDVVVGHWTTTKMSGALPRPVKLQLLDKIQSLQSAVKEALEDANSVTVGDLDTGSRVMSYLFGSVI